MLQRKNILITVMLVCVAFFMLPKATYACNMPEHTKTTKSCCSKAESPAKDTKSCCKKSATKTVNDHSDCGGQCGHCRCNTLTSITALPLPETIVKETPVFVEKMVYYNYNNRLLPSGFYFIWLPPKIS